jgi:hypothetical protein
MQEERKTSFWRFWYLLVLVVLALEIVIFYFITRYYH